MLVRSIGIWFIKREKRKPKLKMINRPIPTFLVQFVGVKIFMLPKNIPSFWSWQSREEKGNGSVDVVRRNFLNVEWNINPDVNKPNLYGGSNTGGSVEHAIHYFEGGGVAPRCALT